MKSALQGIRIIDLTQVMAGPFCTMVLADMGADVIKIESPDGGDMTRRMGGAGMRMKGGENAPFLALNRNKRSVTLDLKDPQALESLYELVRSADVVIENFRPGVAARLKIDYDTLKTVRSDIIYASVSGFGQTGPYAERPGFDLIAQGMSGIMSVTGEPDGKPVKCGVPISDLGAGLYCAIAVLGAYIHRERTGEGQHVETSLFDAAVALSVWESTEYWATGEVPKAFGSAHRLNAPYQALQAADGFLNVGANTEKQWQQLCAALGAPDLADDERFSHNDHRMANRSELVQELEKLLAKDTVANWIEKILGAGVPAGPIHNYRQVFDDPHTRAREMVQSFEHPVAGRVQTLGFPVKFSATPMRLSAPPPLLGQHNAELLGPAAVHNAASGRKGSAQ